MNNGTNGVVLPKVGLFYMDFKYKPSEKDNTFGTLDHKDTTKNKWLNEYANIHRNIESSSGYVLPSINTISSTSGFSSLLPLSMKVTAKTLGQHLVSVQPMSNPWILNDKRINKLYKINKVWVRKHKIKVLKQSIKAKKD